MNNLMGKGDSRGPKLRRRDRKKRLKDSYGDAWNRDHFSEGSHISSKPTVSSASVEEELYLTPQTLLNFEPEEGENLLHFCESKREELMCYCDPDEVIHHCPLHEICEGNYPGRLKIPASKVKEAYLLIE